MLLTHHKNSQTCGQLVPLPIVSLGPDVSLAPVASPYPVSWVVTLWSHVGSQVAGQTSGLWVCCLLLGSLSLQQPPEKVLNIINTQ